MSSSVEAWHQIDAEAEAAAAEAMKERLAMETQQDAEHWAGYFATQAIME